MMPASEHARPDDGHRGTDDRRSVLSTSRFGSDPEVTGRTVILDGEPWTVLGVLPPAAADLDQREIDFWVPLRLDDEVAPRGLHFLTVVARLRTAIGLETARSEAAAVAARLREERLTDHGVELAPLHDELAAEARPLLALLGTAVACVLLNRLRQRGEPPAGRALVIRSAGPAADLMPALRAQVFAIDPQQPVAELTTLDDLIAGSLADRRLVVGLLGTLGAVALLLAAVGLYGVLACLVRQRTREIGIRMAVGASPAAVTRRVIGRGLSLADLGAALGLVLALAAARLLTALLYGVGTADPLAFAAAAALLAVSAAACALPERAAARVDPVRVLRGD
jgi:hypothetical protein